MHCTFSLTSRGAGEAEKETKKIPIGPCVIKSESSDMRRAAYLVGKSFLLRLASKSQSFFPLQLSSPERLGQYNTRECIEIPYHTWTCHALRVISIP